VSQYARKLSVFARWLRVAPAKAPLAP
jgi:hypothetical protein